MRRIFIIFFVAFFGPTINGQSTNPFTPYCDQLTALLPQIQSSTVNVTCTTPLIQDTQIALHYCTTFMTSSLSPTSTATFLATISGLTAQIQGLFAACNNISESATTTTTTTSTTLPPDQRLTLLPQFEYIISNLTSLFNVSSASSASSCCLQPIKNDIDFLVSWTQTLKSGILSQSYGLEMSYIQSLYSNIQQLYSNFTDCQTVGNCCNLTTVLATTTTIATTTVTSTTTSTTTTTTKDPRLALITPLQELLAQLNALLQSVQTYNGTQTGCPSFVANFSNLIGLVQTLINDMMTIDFGTCSATLSSLQSQVAQEAANWALYCTNDVTTTTSTTTTTTTTTIDPRIALVNLAQQLLANINALLQSMQSYNGSQAGVPLFVSNASSAATQAQDLITNMFTIEFSICSGTLTNLQNFFSQLAAAWASYCINDVPTTLAPTTLAPTTEAPTTLATTTLAPTTEAPTTIDPRLALGPLADQLLANLNALILSMQSYSGSQVGVPSFVGNATSAVAQIQSLVANMFTVDFSIGSANLASLESFLSQLAAAWASYCANDVPTTVVSTTEVPTTLAPTTEAPTTLAPTTEIPTTLAPTTEVTTTLAPTTEVPTTLAPTTEVPTTEIPTTIDPRLALTTPLQELLSQLNALLQSVQTYNGTQTGCPPFVANFTNLIGLVQALINDMMTIDFATCSATLSSLQSQATKEAANWASYCANDVPTTVVPTTEVPTTLAPTTEAPTTLAPTTIDPRLALGPLAQQLLANLIALLQSIQSYNGSQAGVPLFISNATLAINQTQDLISGMMTIEFSICSATLTSLESWLSQLAAAWSSYCANDVPTTLAPTTLAPTTEAPTTLAPTTEAPTTLAPTTLAPTTEAPTTLAPTTEAPTTLAPTTLVPTTEAPTTLAPTTLAPTTEAPTTLAPTTEAPTTLAPTTEAPTTLAPTTLAPTTEAPTTLAPTTEAPTTLAPTTEAPTTLAPTTEAPTTLAPTTLAPTTEAPTTLAPTTEAPTTLAPTTETPTTLASTTTTTVATTTTLPPLNTGICNKQYSFLGMAVTACIVNGAFTFQQAYNKCHQNGMIQLAMVNGKQWTAFNAFALIAAQVDTNFWLNGLHDGTAWYAYYPEPVAVYSGIASMITGTPSPGANCLRLYKPGPLKAWTFMANSCAATMSALCQFNN